MSNRKFPNMPIVRKQFDLSDSDREREDALSAPRVAWCRGCDGPVELDEQGNCSACDIDGTEEDHGEERLMLEVLPKTSPRLIECPTCGEDVGKYCSHDDNGNGYNHAARVNEFEATRGVIS